MGFLGTVKENSLPALPVSLMKKINDNATLIEKVLKDAGTLNGLAGIGMGLGYLPTTSNKTLTFKDVVREYNKGISAEEIQAWVWYKRSIGVPMTGWEEYYVRSTTEKGEMIVTTEDAQVFYNSYEIERKVLKGMQLGKFIKKHDQDQRGVFIIFRGEAGIGFVNEKSVKIVRDGIETDPKELTRLVKGGALFYCDGELLPLPIYTYGNMYDREILLERDRETIIDQYGEKIYEAHKKVITDAKPAFLTIQNSDPKERPIITAISDIATGNLEDFGIFEVRPEYTDIQSATELRKTNGKVEQQKKNQRTIIDLDGVNKYSLTTVFKKWLYTLNTDQDFKTSSAVDIAQYYIESAPLKDENLSKEEKASIKANARNEGEELFQRFLNEVLTFEDQQKLDYLWNRVYNGISDINYKRIPVGFEVSARFKSGVLQISPIQREGVAFMQATGSGIVAFDVGVGKTMTAIINLANELMQGKCQRPLIVVPNPTYDKWIKEIMGYTDRRTKEFVPGVLSYTGVTLNDWYNLGTDILPGIDIQHPVPEKSITLVSYEGFKRIGFSQEMIDGFLDDLVNVMYQGPADNERDDELRMQKVRSMIGVGLKETVCDIDIAGFDYLVIDEAHRCKNVFDRVASDEEGKARYKIFGAVSETGQKAFLLSNYLQRKFGRCTMLLTATPFTNSPLEIYSMLSLVAHDYMVANGLKDIKRFFDLFVLPTIELVADYKEQIVEKEIIKSFNNKLVLQKLIYNHINYKTGEEAGVKRPCKVNLPRVNEYVNGTLRRLPPDKQVLTYLRMTEVQRINQNSIVSKLQETTDLTDVLRALSDSLNNAISPYLYRSHGIELDYLHFVNDSPKIKYVLDCVKSVKAWHEAHGQPVSGQIIYMNRGKDFFPFIKEYLIKECGFKDKVEYTVINEKGKKRTYTLSEVEVISGDVSDNRKEMIKDAFLEGIVKVIIGTSTIREGIDLQKYCTCIYPISIDWNPTDFKQLEGRGWRQGNVFGYVRVSMPLVQDSMDVFVFQKLEEKTYRINDLWYRGGRGNVLDLESLDPQEVKLALITDTGRLVKIFFDEEKKQTEREFNRVHAAIKTLEDAKSDIDTYYRMREDSINNVQSFYEKLKDHEVFESDYIRSYLSEPEKKERNKKLLEAKEILLDIEKFMQSSIREDKDLLALLRRLERASRPFDISELSTYHNNLFKEYLSKVKKTEKTLLKPKGCTIDSDLEPVITKYRQEEAACKAKINMYLHDKEGTAADDKNTVRWKELTGEIHRKKSALNIEGKTVQERVQEFSKLNYLMAFKQSDMAPNACYLPTPEEAEAIVKNVDVKMKARRRKIAEAEALLLMLKLLKI